MFRATNSPDMAPPLPPRLAFVTCFTTMKPAEKLDQNALQAAAAAKDAELERVCGRVKELEKKFVVAKKKIQARCANVEGLW